MPDYSAPYVELRTDRDGLAGFGFTFTIGHGSEIVARMVAELAGELVGRPIGNMSAFMAQALEDFTQDSALRWLGPEKGVTHLAAAAVLNATWDLWARMRGVPLWQLLVELEPEELVACLAMRHLGDALTADEAVAMLAERRASRSDRMEHLRSGGYPAYLTSAGWLGYSDEQVQGLVSEALKEGWNAFKMKVDHSHEMFLTPVRVRNGAYELPVAPGFSSEMSQEAIAAYSYPNGTVWRARS